MNPALISLRIAAYFYFFLSTLLFGLAFFIDNAAGLIFISLFGLALGYFILRVRSGLIAGKYWAWVAGIIISGMQIFSLLFPLGIMGLMGLLNTKTRQAFNNAADQKLAT